MTDWTPEKLDALPEGTLIEVDFPSVIICMIRIRSLSSWVTTTGVLNTSEGIAFAAGARIRVVSVPVDALLSDDAIEAARWHSGLGGNRYSIERMLRAAIAHATGGAA